MSIVSINGELVKEEDASISIKDRGFRFGDGIFDTVRMVEGKIFRPDLYIERISAGLEAIKIKFQTTIIEGEILRLLQANDLPDFNGFARISITRGQGSRGYLPVADIKPNFVIELVPLRDMSQVDGRLCVSSYAKPSMASLPVAVKNMQGLNSTLAKIEAREKGYFDALLLNGDKKICECSSANIFWVKDGEFYTPSLNCGILKGVTRSIVMELLEGEGDLLNQGEYSLEDLHDVDEIFITNSVIGVFPIFEIEGVFEDNGRDYSASKRVQDLFLESLCSA